MKTFNNKRILAVGFLALVLSHSLAGAATEAAAKAGPPVQVAPRPVSLPNPAYPADLRAAGVEGEAVLDVQVDARGRVARVTLVSATHTGFGVRALAAAKDWTFEPALSDGKPVPARMQVPVRFVMPQVSAAIAKK